MLKTCGAEGVSGSIGQIEQRLALFTYNSCVMKLVAAEFLPAPTERGIGQKTCAAVAEMQASA